MSNSIASPATTSPADGPNQALAAGWHGPNDIQTLQGLPGTFLWTENGSPAQIRFTFNPMGGGFDGTYQIYAQGMLVEQATFYAIPNNFLIGFAFIGLNPGANNQRTIMVSGMLTDSNWRIIAMALNRIGPQGPQQPGFSAVRMS